MYKQIGTTDSTSNTIHTLLLSRKNEQTHHTQKDIAEIRVVRCPDCEHSKIGGEDKAFSVDVITGKEELIYVLDELFTSNLFHKAAGHEYDYYLPL